MQLPEDIDQPPASPDDAVQDVLDFNYRSVADHLREARNDLQKIYPDLLEHLPETAHDHLKSCLDDIIRATRQLNSAGRLVLGSTEFDAFNDAQVRRQLSR